MSEPLFAHQEAALVQLELAGGSGAVFHEMGLGKTRTALEAFARFRAAFPDSRLLVVCPISLFRAAWAEDVARFRPELSVTVAREMKRPLPSMIKHDILLVNFEWLIQAANRRWLISILISGPTQWMCVVDESARMKNHQSATAKTLLSMRNLFKRRVVMTGTPAPNTELEYFTQMEFVAPGIFGQSFGRFRNTYFYLKDRTDQVIHTQGMTLTRQMMRELYEKRGAHYELMPGARERLMTRIAPHAHFARKAECQDLPPEVDETRLVSLGPRQRIAYSDMSRHLVAEIADKQIAAPVAMAKVMKLREITSGFIIDETGNGLDIGESPKMDELAAVLDEAGDAQAIVWCHFTWEVNRVFAMLEARELGSARTLDGHTEDRERSITDFRSGMARYLVAHPKSAAHGLRFENCALEVFFSLDYSYMEYEQARARIHRHGQRSACTYVHIIAAGTIDEAILKVVRRKADEKEIIYQVVKSVMEARQPAVASK